MTEKQIEKLEQISNLKKDWDGYGALEISYDVIKRTKLLLELINNSKVEIFPTANNSIQIEFENDNCYVELEVFDDCVKPYAESVLLYTEKNKCIPFLYVLCSLSVVTGFVVTIICALVIR